MYWIWLFFTSLNEYLLDRGLGLVAKGTDCRIPRTFTIIHGSLLIKRSFTNNFVKEKPKYIPENASKRWMVQPFISTPWDRVNAYYPMNITSTWLWILALMYMYWQVDGSWCQIGWPLKNHIYGLHSYLWHDSRKHTFVSFSRQKLKTCMPNWQWHLPYWCKLTCPEVKP